MRTTLDNLNNMLDLKIFGALTANFSISLLDIDFAYKVVSALLLIGYTLLKIVVYYEQHKERLVGYNFKKWAAYFIAIALITVALGLLLGCQNI